MNSVTVSRVIDPAIAKALRRAGRKANAAITERDKAIVDAYQTGATLRDIATAVGLSAPGILKIVRRNTP